MIASRSQCHVLLESADARTTCAPGGDIRAFAKCRNERLRLPAFLEHYRRLGVDQFFIIDNDSSDGTTEYLAGQPDVRVFRTADRLSEARSGTVWLNALLEQFGVGCWCVTVDIDELLVYPGSETTSLRTLTTHFDHSGAQAFACLLLDLYPAGPLKDCRYSAGDSLLAAAPYFDVGPYERSNVALCPAVSIRGGMRERVFYPDARARGPVGRFYDSLLDRVAHRAPSLKNTPWLVARRRRMPPCLTKVPLVKWDTTSRYLSMHWLTPRIVARETGVLLHFKFLADFPDRAVREAARGEYYDGATEYRRYARRLAGNPELTFVCDASARFEGTSQLVQLGLMEDTTAWVDARGRGTT